MTTHIKYLAFITLFLIGCFLLTALPTQSYQDGLMVDVIGNTPGQFYKMAQEGDYLYVLGIWDSLHIFDISNPAYPTLVSTLPGFFGYEIEAEGNYVYTLGGRVHIIDVSNPTAPYIAGTYDDFENYAGYTPGLSSLGVRDNAVYVSYNYNDRGCRVYGKMATIDVSDPTSPIRTNTKGRSSGMGDIVTHRGYAYVSSGDQTLIFDISAPLYPQGSAIGLGYDDVLSGSLVAGEDWLFVSYDSVSTICEDGQAWFYVADISDPTDYQQTDIILSYPNETPIIQLYQDGYLYSGQSIAFELHLEMVSPPDFHTPALFEPVRGLDLEISNGFLYMTDNIEDGLTTVRVYNAKVQAEPATAQTLVYTNETGQETTVEIGAGAVMSTTEVSYLPLPTVDSPLPDLWVHQAFDLAGYMPDDQQTLMQFAEPVTVTLPYTSSQFLPGWQFMFWDDTKWIPAEDTCSMVNGERLTANSQQPVANNQLQFSICLPGKYALFIVPLETYFPIARHK